MGKRFAIIATASVLAGAMAVPTVSSAQDARYNGYNSDIECQQQVNNGTTTGGLVGAGIGAVAGRSLASRGNRNEGAVLGAVVGAVIGSQVGKNRHACDDRYQYERNRQQGSYGYPTNNYGYNNNGYNQYPNGGYAPSQYGNDDYYNSAPRHHNSGYNGYNSYQNRNYRYSAPVQYSHQNNCGWGTAAYQLPNGRVVHDQVYMCRQRNGEWVVTNR